MHVSEQYNGGRGGLSRRAALALFAPVATVPLIGLSSLLAPAVAQDTTSWIPFPGQRTNSASAVSFDREFVKEWENNPPKGFATLSPANIAPMQAAIKRYTDIVARGGWRPVPDVAMTFGQTDPAVAVLAERLTLSGDLKDGGGSSTYFDAAVEKAVKRFQASNGLSPTGVVDKRTIAALNVSAQARLRQLKLNLSRLQELSRSTAKRYVMVNIPAAQIEAVEDGAVVTRHSGVVGKQDRQSPLLRTQIHEINFNPMWTLPPTVISQDLIPKGQELQRKNQNVLLKFGIDAYDESGRKLSPSSIDWSSSAARNLVFRQQPGKDNPLGFLKINFHNNYSVYMHDTPSDTLFGRNFRAASSGCVRVRDIETLGAWLLAGNGGWTAERIKQIRETGETKNVTLKSPVALYWVYITAWATDDGIVQFRRDIYNKDGVGETASTY
jgi:L,D-transpeptidase YcbB